MAIDFSTITLEVIDLNTNATPDIFINQNSVTFSKRVLEDLNYAPFVQYCVDAGNHVFAIKPCKGNESRATAFSKQKSEQTTTLSCGNKNLHEILVHMIPEYQEKRRYKVIGYWDMENKIMYYDMTTAEISEFHANKK